MYSRQQVNLTYENMNGKHWNFTISSRKVKYLRGLLYNDMTPPQILKISVQVHTSVFNVWFAADCNGMLTAQVRHPTLLYLHAYSKGLKKRVKTSMQLIITAAKIFYVQYAQFATKEALVKWSKTAPAQKMTKSRSTAS